MVKTIDAGFYGIANNMLDLFVHKMLIIIVCRRQTIRNVQRILVVEAGQIIEDSTFEQLLNAHGKFTELWEKQTKNADIERTQL